MTTREAVIKKIREAISELKKTLLMIFAEAGESGDAPPKIHACPDEETANNEQITNESLTIPKELALSIINDAKKLHEEASKHIESLSFLKQSLISIKDLETIASRDIEIGTKCKFRVAIKFLDERKAEWRNTAPPDKITGRISLGFNVEEGKPVRLSISLESARLLVETLTPYLHLTQSRISAGIPRSDVLPSIP